VAKQGEEQPFNEVYRIFCLFVFLNRTPVDKFHYFRGKKRQTDNMGSCTATDCFPSVKTSDIWGLRSLD